MAEPTATADAVDTAENAIEDDLGELEAILAEVNADTEPSGDDSEQQGSAEAETEEGSAQGQTDQAAADAAAGAPGGEAQDGPAPDPAAEASAELEMQAAGEQDVPDGAEAEPGDTVPDSERSPLPGALKTALACAPRLLSWPLVAVLTILDKPFAKVSLKVKNVLGYVAIATTITAVATWVLAGFIRLR